MFCKNTTKKYCLLWLDKKKFKALKQNDRKKINTNGAFTS